MANFALIGLGGYIAPRHLQAINETGNTLIAALDPSDSVGIIDKHFPDADFFIEPERFDRYVDKQRRSGNKVDYVSICSPNYLHDSHIRLSLRNQADAICEKPLVLNPWNIDALKIIEQETGKKIYNILQLRLHDNILKLKEYLDGEDANEIYDVDLTYIASRGKWYDRSWKGNIEKSGGVATNIGIHFFDMLSFLFGDVGKNIVHLSQPHKAAGFLMLKKARVRWFVSIDYNDIPDAVKAKGERTFRSITMNHNEEIEFSNGFTNLHIKSYQDILNGGGFGIEAARPAIETVFAIRNAVPVGKKGDYHPFIHNMKV
ncbi:MAG: Gfo/Idh/MocA family oxidoreductase [Bacteroidales bacterium]|jgi:UDP-N-acetyl-2-amino-2-deoxyglucuronate dehydrogenase|nr:Gfo/Idh/MocA family oxidoreductase [Bacteroidales bacterium]